MFKSSMVGRDKMCLAYSFLFNPWLRPLEKQNEAKGKTFFIGTGKVSTLPNFAASIYMWDGKS